MTEIVKRNETFVSFGEINIAEIFLWGSLRRPAMKINTSAPYNIVFLDSGVLYSLDDREIVFPVKRMVLE